MRMLSELGGLHLKRSIPNAICLNQKRSDEVNCVFRVLPPWSNLWLLGAIAVSMILHMLILYVPALSLMFSVCA